MALSYRIRSRGVRWLLPGLTSLALFGALTVLLAQAQSGSGAKSVRVSDAEVKRVHDSMLLLDTHNDLPWRVQEGFDPGPRSPEWHTDLARLKEGGVGAVFFSVYVPGEMVEGNKSAHHALDVIDAVRHGIVDRYPKDFALATSVREVEQARKDGKIAALMGLEGGHAIEDNLGLLRDYYTLGVRYMTLTHTNTNNWADSAGDITKAGVRHHNGLTDFGKQVVREMNRLGMMVDISHVADKTFWDALETSRAPIIASHSGSRAIANHVRNMTDEMIVALAKKGGVVQINFNCAFLTNKFAPAQAGEAARLEGRYKELSGGKQLSEAQQYVIYDRIRKEMNLTRATLNDVVDHIDHVRQIAGIGALGIGSDFNGISCAPEGLDDVSKFPNLTRALLERGYSTEDIRKIYGGNLLRVMRAVEVVAGH